MPVVHTTLVPFLPREVTMWKFEDFSATRVLQNWFDKIFAVYRTMISRISRKISRNQIFLIALQNDFTNHFSSDNISRLSRLNIYIPKLISRKIWVARKILKFPHSGRTSSHLIVYYGCDKLSRSSSLYTRQEPGYLLTNTAARNTYYNCTTNTNYLYLHFFSCVVPKKSNVR